ncbi:MAG TPA: putative baseplate assembly protein [Pyrinomonadaceae bacterium]|jgi:hypothetical protein|nr:putative baseplate assembly protein [Pyrinomonadaceae bacterium]
MPLPVPILDDRSYQQLRDELVRRIPVYTPEWTDHNASDPGITLIELFAFLGENLLFRFNQIPESTQLAFLRLLQIPLRSAQPSRAILSMTTTEAEGALVPMSSEVKAGNLSFETLTETVAWPISFVAMARVSSALPNKDTEPEVVDFAIIATSAVAESGVTGIPVYYETQTVPPDGVGPPADFDQTVDGMLWVAVLAEKNYDPSKMSRALLNLGFVPDPVVPTISQIKPCSGTGTDATTGPAMEWQVSTGKLDNNKQPVYRTVNIEGDTTRGLNQEGVVRVRLPRDLTDMGVFPMDNADLRGTGQYPPALDDEKVAAKVRFWLRAFRRDGGRFGKVQYVGANAAQVVQTRKARTEFVGMGTGQPNQRYKLIQKSVVEGSLVIEVEEIEGWKRWTGVDGFHASAPDDRHFVVDSGAGEVHFGNGIQGLPPQLGQRIRALEYRYGGGIEGNVPAKAISKLTEVPPDPAKNPRGTLPAVKVSNPLRAQGGGAAETIAEALLRIPGELRRRDRAVTADDFRELALATPGASIGRTECLPRFYPPTKKPERAGVVSVVVWPREDALRPNAPLPDRNLLRAVCEWLDLHRLVTTELYVIPPTYHKVAVSVGLKVKPGYGVEAVRRWVELVLRQYLAPLPPYGPSGGGWPLGRLVHGPELEAICLQVEGVEFLENLKVAGWNGTTWKEESVKLQPYEVPELAEISVVEGPKIPDPGYAIEPPTSKTDTGAVAVPVPIPIIREEC